MCCPGLLGTWALGRHTVLPEQVQPRAVHGTPLAAEKRVHFDKIDAQFVELGIDKDLMQEVGAEAWRRAAVLFGGEVMTSTGRRRLLSIGRFAWGLCCAVSQVGGIRVRQHVNPLKKDLQVPAGPLNWAEVYQGEGWVDTLTHKGMGVTAQQHVQHLNQAGPHVPGRACASSPFLLR